MRPKPSEQPDGPYLSGTVFLRLDHTTLAFSGLILYCMGKRAVVGSVVRSSRSMTVSAPSANGSGRRLQWARARSRRDPFGSFHPVVYGSDFCLLHVLSLPRRGLHPLQGAFASVPTVRHPARRTDPNSHADGRPRNTPEQGGASTEIRLCVRPWLRTRHGSGAHPSP